MIHVSRPLPAYFLSVTPAGEKDTGECLIQIGRAEQSTDECLDLQPVGYNCELGLRTGINDEKTFLVETQDDYHRYSWPIANYESVLSREKAKL